MFVNARLIKSAKNFVVYTIITVVLTVLSLHASAFSGKYRENVLNGEPSSIVTASPVNVTLIKDGTEYKYTYFPVKCSDFLVFAGIALSEIDSVSVPFNQQLYNNMIITVSTFEYETMTVEEVAVCKYDLVEVDTIPKGQLNVITPGTDGLKKVTYLVKKVSGQPVESEVVGEEVLVQPVKGVAEYGTGGTVTASDGTVYNYSYKKYMEATAYTYVPGKTTMTTATGAKLAKGIVAVDPKVIPMHTKMYIASDTFEYGPGAAEDTGGVIKGNIVDLAFMSYDECVQFGRRNMWVYILE